MPNYATRRKIVLLGPISPLKGGISAFNTSLADELIGGGHDVHTVSWNNAMVGVKRREQTDPSMPGYPGTRYLLNWYSPRSWFCAARYSASLNADLVIAHWTLPEVAPVYAVINLFLRRRSPTTKIVYIVHNSEPHEKRFADSFLRWLGFRDVSFFLLHADSEKQKVTGLIRDNQILSGFHPIYNRYLNLEKPTVNPPDYFKFKAWLRETPNIPVLLFFGFVRPYKGLEFLLRALTIFTGARLVVAGAISKGCRSLPGYASTLGLKHRVYWFDRYIEDNEVPAIFAMTDLVALPYQNATQSGVANLAFAFDKPVVTTNVGGLAECVQHKITGYVVPPNDPNKFAQALQSALSNHDALREGIINLKAKRSWSRYCKILLSCV